MVRLLQRSLVYYWRTNAAVVAGIATAVAVLAGALLVGQSVRASLRALIDQRLGATDYVVSADRFFSAGLAEAFDGAPGAAGPAAGTATDGRPASCALIVARGALRREGSRRQAHDVNVYGVDERFWRFHGLPAPAGLDGRAAILGAPLAAQLGASPGDTLLLRIDAANDVPGESLFGRREDTTRTIRLDCRGVASATALGEFALRPGQGDVASVFVPVARLQRELAQLGRANTILISRPGQDDESGRLLSVLRERLSTGDAGLRVRSIEDGAGVAVESARVLLEPPAARAALDVAREAGRPASGVLAYLANAIRANGRDVPYSVIAAADLGQATLQDVRYVSGTPMSSAPDAARSVWLNEWAWKELGVPIGDPIDVDYYYWEDGAGLVTRTARFALAGVVAIGGDVDATLAPDVPGVTDADSLREWNPPFPVDLGRIRPQDEEYWERHRGTPKAFVTLSTGQALWGGRFGDLTAVRTTLPADAVSRALAGRIAPEAVGFTVAAVRRTGLESSRGAVDLGEYFLYFSAFLIAAAVMLTAAFFRLGIEQRVRELGTLRAVGFPIATVRRAFLAEGAVLLVVGSLAGVLGALTYGGVLVTGLRTWWVGAVGTEHLSLHLSWRDLAAGVGVGAAASLGAVLWTLRGVAASSPRALLAGVILPPVTSLRRAWARHVVPLVTFVLAVLVLAGSAARAIPEVAGFFSAGALLLLSTLSLASRALRAESPRPLSGHGWRAIGRLAYRGAAHRPARSLLPVVLIASATFVIVSVEAFRKHTGGEGEDRRSGTGGFAFVASAATPLVASPSTPAGLEALGFDPAQEESAAEARFVSFRERAGDEASCLNLYAPREPRILGAPSVFLAEGRFSFASSLAATDVERHNPWLLLQRSQGDEAVPAIADANSLQYSLHLAVGDETTVRGGDGEPVRLRIVAALDDSVLQGALIVSEADFLRVFPDQVGFRYFLIDLPANSGANAGSSVSERLADAGLRVESAAGRLASFHRVENTYLSTFQSLGALGLVLGTVGLLAVLLRNVLERRSELALLRALGYRQGTLATMVTVEHVLLLLAGLACGTVSALVAIVPALTSRGGTVPILMVGLLVAGVSVVGIAASVLGGLVVLRSPLVAALRAE